MLDEFGYVDIMVMDSVKIQTAMNGFSILIIQLETELRERSAPLFFKYLKKLVLKLTYVNQKICLPMLPALQMIIQTGIYI